MFRTCKVGVVRLVKIGPLNFAFCFSRQQHAMQDITPYARPVQTNAKGVTLRLVHSA
jgi:hypothetical protein